MSDGICDFDPCDRDVRSHGLCDAHIKQERRGGPLKPLRGRRANPRVHEGPSSDHCLGGCGRTLTKAGEKPRRGFPREHQDGICQQCWRSGPRELPTDMALEAVAMARQMRAEGLLT